MNLTRIYTRTGDDGSTSLGDFSRTMKTDVRLAAYADVDEANSALGVVLALGAPPNAVAETLTRVQNELFDVGADLCTPTGGDGPQLRVTQEYIDRLEADCDQFNTGLPNLPVVHPAWWDARLCSVARRPHRHPARRAGDLGRRWQSMAGLP